MNISLCRRASVLLAVWALQGCGGSGVDDSGVQASGSGRGLEIRGAAEALFAQDGQPSASARHPPAGWRHVTAAGLYASARQVTWEALTVEPYTVQVDVDGFPSPAAAVEKTLRDFRWSPDSARAAFYVRADAPEQAVAVADALTAAGVPLVFLVIESAS